LRILRRLLIFGVVIVLAVSVLLGGFWLIDPVSFRLMVFQPVREVRLFAKELGGLGSLHKIERISLPAAEIVRIDKSHPDQINIVADLYRPKSVDESVPGILFLHGSSPYGRRAALVRMVGAELSTRGWIMLAPDARGYGDTDDPTLLDSAAGWAVDTDIRRLLTYLVNIPGVDPQRIVVIGHSIGAGHALEGALDDVRVSALILVGPARFRDGIEGSVGRWERVRYSADRRLNEVVSEELLLKRYRNTDIAGFASGPLSKPGHIPILIVDGELEGSGNQIYLKSIVDQIAAPVEYETLQDTGHYCGVRSFFGSNDMYYREEQFRRFPDVVDRFLATYLAKGNKDVSE